MKFQFLVPIKPLRLQPTPLTKLAAEVRRNAKFSSPELPPEVSLDQTPPRSLDEIFRDLEEGQSDHISFLEWVYCINQKPIWDAQHSREQQLNTARLIWQVAIENYSLKQRLCWHLAYYYDGNKNCLARSLVETFWTLADAVGNEDLTVEILVALKQRDRAAPIAQLAKREALTLRELLTLAQLPTDLSIIDER
mgnify:CR=1 FL=1